jgi:glutaminase
MRAAGGFSRALAHQVTMPPRKDPVTAYLRELRDELMPVDAGEVARYIPELAKADPRHLGIAIATTDGRLFEAGDTGVAFTIQSVSKPFAYGHVFACHGRPAVFDRVDGDSFNSIVLDDGERPLQPHGERRDHRSGRAISRRYA